MTQKNILITASASVASILLLVLVGVFVLGDDAQEALEAWEADIQPAMEEYRRAPRSYDEALMEVRTAAWASAQRLFAARNASPEVVERLYPALAQTLHFLAATTPSPLFSKLAAPSRLPKTATGLPLRRDEVERAENKPPPPTTDSPFSKDNREIIAGILDMAQRFNTTVRSKDYDRSTISPLWDAEVTLSATIMNLLAAEMFLSRAAKDMQATCDPDKIGDFMDVVIYLEKRMGDQDTIRTRLEGEGLNYWYIDHLWGVHCEQAWAQARDTVATRYVDAPREQ